MKSWSLVACLLFVGLSGCADLPDEDPDAAGPIAPALPAITDAPLASYLHDVSTTMAGVRVDNAITEHYRTSVDEGIELDTWILRPDVPEPVGLVLEITPYYGGGDPAYSPFGWGTQAEYLVPRGFAVGISSVRGTGNSGGCFTQGGPDEGRDSAAVIEHMAQQDWSNGNVGLMGVSYPGTTPQDVWVEAPPSLKTIVPISGISDMYKYNFVNGVPIDIQGFGFNTYYWAIVGLGPAGLSGGSQVTDPSSAATAVAGEACTDQADVQEGGVSSTVDGNKDAYWQVRDFLAEYQEDPAVERASVFYIHGLQDWNVKPHMMEDWLEAVQDSGVPYKVWLGQWGHAWPSPSTCMLREDGSHRSCRDDWWTQTMVAWFDQFLKEKETGILDAPAVQIQDDDMQWRHEHRFPMVDETRRLALGDGVLGEEATGEVRYYDYQGNVWDFIVPGQVAGQPLPERPRSEGPDRVVWRSDVLAKNVTISGQPVFHGNVTASGQRASLILSLAEERPDGSLRSFNFAAQSLNHVASLEAGEEDISGVRQEVHLRFFPQDDVVHKGNRIVLIAAGNTVGGPGPNLQPVSDGSDITIGLDGAWLDLPIDATRVLESPQPYAPFQA